MLGGKMLFNHRLRLPAANLIEENLSNHFPAGELTRKRRLEQAS
jgi:hypothetical protein